MQYKVYEDYIKFDTEEKRRTIKISFPIKYVENADLHKPVLNKIKTIHE